MSGLSPLTMWQGNSKELMIEQNRSGKSRKLAKPKFVADISASLKRFSSLVKAKAKSRSSKKAKKSSAAAVEISSPVAPDSSAVPNGAATVPVNNEVRHDIVESPAAVASPTCDLPSTPSSSPPAHTIASVPSDIVRNIMDHLKPMDVICLGLTEKRMWQSAKSHLESEGLYPARFILTDNWGRYSARPTVYYDLPERLETWMAPRVLFHGSIPRVFVEDQARANNMMVYLGMVQQELGRTYIAPTCIDVLEYTRPAWVLPQCKGLFEKWVHMGAHDMKDCPICCEAVAAARLLCQAQPKKSGNSNHGGSNPFLQNVAPTISGPSLKLQTIVSRFTRPRPKED